MHSNKWFLLYIKNKMDKDKKDTCGILSVINENGGPYLYHVKEP